MVVRLVWTSGHLPFYNLFEVLLSILDLERARSFDRILVDLWYCDPYRAVELSWVRVEPRYLPGIRSIPGHLPRVYGVEFYLSGDLSIVRQSTR